MLASLAPSSRHLLWPTRARRRPTSTTTRRTGPRHTATRPPTAASVSTHRWQGRSMGQNMIRPPRTLTEKSSCGSEEVRSMGGTGLPTAQSTRPLLPLYLRFEQGARARAQPYDLGRTLHGTRYRHSRLFLLYPSFIDYYIPFSLHYCNIGVKILQGQLDEERRRRVELEARMTVEREAEQQRMTEILNFMQSLGAATGVAPPASLFAPIRPPDQFSTPVSMHKF